MPTTYPTYDVAINFSGSSWTSLITDVRGVSIQRSVANLFNPLNAAELVVQLDNMAGDYSPQNSGSRFGNLALRPNLPIRVEATFSGSTRSMFKGKIDAISVQPNLNSQRTASIAARDSIKGLVTRTITTSAFTETPVGSLFVSVLSQTAVSSFFVDTLLTDVSPFFWAIDQSGPAAIDELLAAGFYQAWVDGHDTFRVQNRYWDMSATVVASYDNNGYNTTYVLTDDNVWNRWRLSGTTRRRASNVATLAWIAEPIQITGSGFISFFLDYLDPDILEPSPADNMVTPVSSSDYLTWTASDGTGNNRTATTSVAMVFFGQTAVATVFNGHSDTVYLTKFQLSGKSLQRQPTLAVRFDDSSSQAVYGQRDYSLQDDIMARIEFLDDYGTFLKNRTKDPVASVEHTIRNDFPAQLDYDFAQLVHLRDGNLGYAENHALIAINHEITPGPVGWIHETTLSLEGVRDQNVLILDHPTYGQLDARQLGF